ncbi:hypothetical protein THSYN_06680 [Candidatus Thiodictyon syntrophicum]|jgi:DNA-binding response OmpR family regulator/EAL domain-containing protein (putative c-di-GMP-specific phosphodiesterase class I)|uniref:Response regulatory domain-containing protein n=2 Tax=Candidatus Thiodictyon syntrophicum TaxID=1166950 RepID=A0A2K8U542_9GAMM|nr:hypothetical protein THSYN_06680 [Candidatus Thiodictyon syntrophicum]
MEINSMNAQTQVPSARGSVLLLSTDVALVAAMDPHFTGFGLDLAVFDTPAQLGRRVQDQGGPGGGRPPSLLVLVDLLAFPHVEAFASLGADARAGHPARPPLVCLGQPENLRQRLASLRVGAAAWLPRDLNAADLAARAAALVGPADGVPERVLVVDDQPVSALFAARVLEQAGMIAQQVFDPLLALSAMDRFAPDLVLMDLHMPGASGIELTAVIREQERYADLPILFLSVELDPARQLDALRVGGDDFLAKPVPPQRLVACVRQRLARARHQAQVRKTAVTASRGPTGLVDRERLLARLDRLIHARARDWGLIYLEQAGDAAALHWLAGAASARAGAGALAARVGEHGVAVLVRRAAPSPLGAFAEALGQGVRVDLQAGAAAVAPAFGVGWCAVAAGGGESVTLVSRARKVARISLHRRQGRAEGYQRPSAGPHSVAAPHPVLEAITASQFHLLFQPMVPLRGTAAPCYEATLRLAMPDGELLAPGAFVPAALQAGQAPQVDRWLLATGLDALRERRVAGQPVVLFLHQSFASAADEGWVERVRDAIVARNLVQCRPVIQWQLAEVERYLDLAVRRAGQLVILGIRPCLNAVTEEESSLQVLERLPVSFVRFARSADWRLPPERLRALVHRAHARRARVIVTGVEGPEAIAPLHRAGVDLIQGPYIQPPGEAMDFDFTDGQG